MDTELYKARPSDGRNLLDAAVTMDVLQKYPQDPKYNGIMGSEVFRACVAVTVLAAQTENEPSWKSNYGVIENEQVNILDLMTAARGPFSHPSALFFWLLFTRRSGCHTGIVTFSRRITGTADKLYFP